MEYTFSAESEDSIVVTRTSHVQTHEVVFQFYYFLLGAGFSHENIMDAFETAIEEFSHRNKVEEECPAERSCDYEGTSLYPESEIDEDHDEPGEL